MNSLNMKKWVEVLALVYRQKETAEVRRGWQDTVMKRIRDMEPPTAKIMELLFLERFAWRFAAFASVFTAILSLGLFQGDFQTEYELARVYMVDPIGFGLIQSFFL